MANTPSAWKTSRLSWPGAAPRSRWFCGVALISCRVSALTWSASPRWPEVQAAWWAMIWPMPWATCLSSYLSFLLERQDQGRYEIITPPNPVERGCQLSILVPGRPRALLAALKERGVLADFREPNIIRVAPVPLYNTFHEVGSFARI